MTRGRRRWLLVGGVVVVLLMPVLVLAASRLGAFDVFSDDDSLDDPAAPGDLVVCLAENADRFAPNEVAESVLTVPLPNGGFNLRPGVDDFSITSSGGDIIASLRVDLDPSASDEVIEEIQDALLARVEVETVLRSARAAACAERASETKTTTR